jgi:transcriptional regulator with XRE-family HTH domain
VSIGAQLQKARRRAGLTLRDVADASGGVLTAGGLSFIETGKHSPNLRSLEALAKVLRVTVVVGPKGVSVRG